MDHVMTFTNSEEARIREALVKYIERVSAGTASISEASIIPSMLAVMFPGSGKTLTTQVNTPLKG